MSAGDAQPAAAESPRRIQRRAGEPEWLWSLDAVEMIGFMEADGHFQYGDGECGTDPTILAPVALKGVLRDRWLEGFRYYFASLGTDPCCAAGRALMVRGFDRESSQ